jgi:beta-N-acetylhexosaminidase
VRVKTVRVKTVRVKTVRVKMVRVTHGSTGQRARRRAVAATLVAALAASTLAGRSAASASATPVPRGCDAAVNLADWSFARLAAQVVAVPTPAGAVGSVAREVRTGFGGVLLFGASAPASLGATLGRLQASTPQHLGTLVMTDEEGGGVRRLDNLVAAFPWARTMAATLTPAAITSLATRVGAQLRAAGVTVDLAPVLDVDGRAVYPGSSDPDGLRAFSGTPAVVATDGVAFARGLTASHVLPVVKHFPGHAGATGNTDDGPAATRPWPVLEATALPPFEAALRAGVGAVMVSNARVPGLTPLPASLSAKVVAVLRHTLHFRGLLVTDSLTAGAIAAASRSVEAAAVTAIGAGEDLVLLGEAGTVTADASLAVAVAGAIAHAAATGTLPRATLEAAAAQVLAARGVDACR